MFVLSLDGEVLAFVDCTFGIGPAGTGKTYLAVARAVEALEASDVRRIILVRPAVEAGEKLGFLRPRIKASGATSMMFLLSSFSTLSKPNISYKAS
jgi:predicted ribonuclease YlaK